MELEKDSEGGWRPGGLAYDKRKPEIHQGDRHSWRRGVSAGRGSALPS